jgi:hypothetical protein
MVASDNDERKYIHGALALTVQSASDLETVRELIDQRRQVLAIVPSRMSRADYDALTEQLMDLGGRTEAMLTAVQVGVGRPKGWSRWLARLNATRTFILTPKTLSDPSVAVFWAPEADTGAQRLVVGEFTTLRLGSTES